MKKLTVTNVLLGLLTMAIISQPLIAGANHQPADKVVAAGSTLERPEPQAATPILVTNFKSSSPSDLMIQVTLECSITTELRNEGGPGVEESFAEAEGKIDVWAEFDGKVVPVSSSSSTPQPHNPSTPGTVEKDSVTFCNNHQKFRVTDTEGNDPPDGTDTYETYLRTKSANAFNWVWLNTGNGPHTLKVYAQFTSPSCGPVVTDPDTGEETCSSGATGLVGNRTVIVEPTKMANDTQVVEGNV